ncbi:EamA family transporter [Klebsiella michiganensis]|uniref:EamA family transporter n=1 Tax=Klebsiella michiganensis TaxID=1134687 RepID=UPI0021CC6956|nr:EamA family transporter [Klebsiella michiganensis]
MDAPSIFSRKKVAYACATLCCLLWGSSYPAIKSGYELFQIATDDVPSKIVFAGYRFLFAGALLLLFALAQRKPIARLNPRQCGQLAILGVTQTSIQESVWIWKIIVRKACFLNSFTCRDRGDSCTVHRFPWISSNRIT